MKKESQKSMIREYLQHGGMLTPMDALEMFGSFRLASIICELRKDGEDIITEDFPVRGRNGEKKIVARYRMAVGA